MSACAARAFPERLPLRRISLLLAHQRNGGTRQWGRTEA
jgi:hypothetical protein